MIQSRCQHRAKGPKLWVGADLQMNLPLLDLSCPSPKVRSSQLHHSDPDSRCSGLRLGLAPGLECLLNPRTPDR